PKSSESSYTETFSLQKFKNGDTCSPFLSICRANAISCALPREMLKNADYTTFSTDRRTWVFTQVLFSYCHKTSLQPTRGMERALPRKLIGFAPYALIGR
ncbi:MAG: hypothetical protein ACLVFS_04165, partial [Butyricicoccus sp.]